MYPLGATSKADIQKAVRLGLTDGLNARCREIWSSGWRPMSADGEVGSSRRG